LSTAGNQSRAKPGIQPEREFRESKFKSIKAKWLSFAFIYFSESGLFNALWAKKQKKSTRVSGCVRNVSSRFPLLAASARQSAGSIPADEFVTVWDHSSSFCLTQENVENF